MFVIKYGGSRVSPTEDSYDDVFISDLAQMVRRYPQGQFMVIIGGGAKARQLQRKGIERLQSGDSIESLFVPDQDLVQQGKELNPGDEKYHDKVRDLLGIKATRENAAYVINKFQQLGVRSVCPEVVFDPTHKVQGDYRIYFAGGYKPGNSTDWVTMRLALTYGADKVIKVSDFDVVKNIKPSAFLGKTKDERNALLATAEDLPRMGWKQMLDLVGKEWVPGANTCLDGPAASLGYEHHSKMILYICRESQLENVFSGNEPKYVGTIVRG